MSTTHVPVQSPIALPPAEGEALWFMGFLATIQASAGETGGRVAVIHHLGPQDAGSPRHVHHRENEWFYILDGELTVWVGGQVISAPAGSFVFGPQGTPHTFTVSSPQGASFLLVTEPGGFEAFMRTCAEPARSLTLPPPPASPPDPAQMAALAAEYGIEIIGPPGIPSQNMETSPEK
jgi:quercetin dioxygenase-like cupin family protein